MPYNRRGRPANVDGANRTAHDVEGSDPQDTLYTRPRRKSTRNRCRQPVEVVTPQGVRCAGYLVPTQAGLVFERSADSSKHMLRRPHSWALQQDVLSRLVALSVSKVVIRDKRVGTWTASLSDFLKHGFEVDRGHGPQLGLESRWFDFSPNGET